MVHILGLDIGGANLKAAHLAGTAMLHPFELWKHPGRLPSALAELLGKMPPFDVLAVTMTGELCDCFESKRQGVDAILDAVETVAVGKKVLVWRIEKSVRAFLSGQKDPDTFLGGFADPAAARQTPLQTAAANWLALAVYAGRFVPEGPALLVDVGSTTTDLVPLEDGIPVPRGQTDTERFGCQELVYTGAWRTPICALLGSAVLAEVFATALDAYLLLGDIAESDDRRTADGRPATQDCAHARLARMLGSDGETCAAQDTLRLARQAALVQQSLLRHAYRTVQRGLSGKPARVIVAGSGEFLARQALRHEGIGDDRLFSMRTHLGPLVSSAACAHALAVLAQEQEERVHGTA
jgi:probable H4MPT-linked C1 transfer pathway protein